LITSNAQIVVYCNKSKCIQNQVWTSCVSLQILTVENYKHGMFERSFGNEETLNFQQV